MTYAKVRDRHLPRRKKGVFVQSWWVIAFISLCGLVYFNAVGKKNKILAHLDQRLEVLNREKVALLEEKEDLLLQMNSQDDPAWIQLTLMKNLGLVPEGQLKVYFTPSP